MKSACLRVPVCVLLLACVACTPVRSTLRPPYLVGGVVYDERGLQQYAESQCARETGGAPPHEFTTDGCSLRSEEHTSELQSRGHLVCRLLLEKKNITTISQARFSPICRR